MPYIKNERKSEIETVASLTTFLTNLTKLPDLKPGDLNYIITSLLVQVWDNDNSYKTLNDLVGVLECAKLELYRRVGAPYENKKLKENGDVF